MTREEVDFISGMNMCDEISNEAYKKIMCHCEEQEPCEDAVSRQAVAEFLRNHANDFDDAKVRMAFGAASSLVENTDNVPPVKPIRKKCKWILYDYRTLVPREHGNIPNPYWRIPARYKTELKYCPYCGREIDYSEVDAEIEERAKNEDN